MYIKRIILISNLVYYAGKRDFFLADAKIGSWRSAAGRVQPPIIYIRQP